MSRAKLEFISPAVPFQWHLKMESGLVEAVPGSRSGVAQGTVALKR